MTNTMTMSEARRITSALIAEHGLVGWTVKFDNARRRAGQCSYGPRTISLSKPLMAQRSYADTMNTITHELAHALVGHSHGHDAVWAAKHRQLGGDGKRCFDHLDESAPWIGTCSHGKQFARYRQPKRLDGWRCKCVRGGSPITWQTRAQRAAEVAVVASVKARKAAAPEPVAAQTARTITSRPVGKGTQLNLF